MWHTLTVIVLDEVTDTREEQREEDTRQHVTMQMDFHPSVFSLETNFMSRLIVEALYI